MIPNSSSKSIFPSVSIAIPTYNESTNIERIIREFLSTQYPNLIEILVADGGSTDGTQDIINGLALQDSRVKLLHNPLKIQSAALNIMIEKSTGDIFLRADAHSDYAPNYIEKCVEALLKSKALNVGGAQRFVAKTEFQAGVALASKSFFGSGGAKYRNPNYDGYADTVYLGCFWRSVLLKISGYDSNAYHNEDAELNMRLHRLAFDNSQITDQDAEQNQKLLSKSNCTIYVSSDICVWYYPRNNWQSLFIQYFKYGKGRYLTTTKHKNQFQLRGKLPFLVIFNAIILLLMDLSFPGLALPTMELTPFVLILLFIESLRVTKKFAHTFASEMWRGNQQQIPSVLSRCFFCSVTLMTIPIAHFSGFAYQMFQHKILRL
jgi:succinoglycan biosynthesis protein ExoA